MHLLVTGANGFIGKNVVDRMNGMPIPDHLEKVLGGNGSEIFISTTDIEGVVDIKADLTTANLPIDQLRRSPVHGVIHLASSTGVRSFTADAFTNNVMCTNNLLNWMRKNEIHFLVNASSSSVYGNTRIMDEASAALPVSDYARSKVKCESLIKKWVSEGNIAVNFRIFNAIGRHQRADMLPAVIARHLKSLTGPEGQEEELNIFGNRIRSWTYVGDVINAFWSAVDKFYNAARGTSLTVNLGSVASLTQTAMIKAMVEASTVKEAKPNYTNPHPLDLQRTKPDLTRFESLFGWVPNPRNVDTGITELLNQFGILAA